MKCKKESNKTTKKYAIIADELWNILKPHRKAARERVVQILRNIMRYEHNPELFP